MGRSQGVMFGFFPLPSNGTQQIIASYSSIILSSIILTGQSGEKRPLDAAEGPPPKLPKPAPAPPQAGQTREELLNKIKNMNAAQ